MKGRKAVPVEVRERRGDLSRGKSEADTVVIGGRREGTIPRPPPGLTSSMRSIWRVVCGDLIAAHIYDEVDVYAIEAFCVVLGRAREARQVLNRPGKLTDRLLAPTVRGTMAHPLLAVERESLKEARLMGEMLGLSPSARTRLGLKRPTGKTLKDMQGQAPASARSRLTSIAGGRVKDDEDDDD